MSILEDSFCFLWGHIWWTWCSVKGSKPRTPAYLVCRLQTSELLLWAYHGFHKSYSNYISWCQLSTKIVLSRLKDSTRLRCMPCIWVILVWSPAPQIFCWDLSEVILVKRTESGKKKVLNNIAGYGPKYHHPNFIYCGIIIIMILLNWI